MASTSKETEQQHEEFTIEIPENLETSLREEFCIYSVPPTLRQINPSAYSPQVISIGPIHHAKSELKNMQIQKLRYFKEFCKRKPQSSIDDFGRLLLNQINEQQIRHCYAYDCSDISSTKFVNMILLDSVFILELFLRNNNVSKYHDDYIMGKPWLRTDVQQDLILLENQLPFSILDKLYNFAKQSFVDKEKHLSFHELTCNYFFNLKPKKTEIPNPKHILHFTDLVRCFWIHNHPSMRSGIISRLNSITKMRQAGLKLTPAQNRCFLEIEFKPGITCLKRAELQLPCFEVDDTTEFVVRNLMALEQCHYPYETYICNYIRLWDFLIDTAEDVDLLVEKKIIVNGLGDGAAVADLVNKLCNQIAEVQSCYFEVATQLNGYYDDAYNHTMATLRSVYFGDLWRGTGTSAAVVLLLLTFIQTVYSVLGH